MSLSPRTIQFIVILGLLGIGMIVAGLVQARRYAQIMKTARESATWPKVKGKVVSTRVEATANHRNAILPRVTFHYAVGQGQYRGNTIAVGINEQELSEQATRQLLAMLQPGAEVTVFHHPERHHEAVLYPGITEPLKKLRRGNFGLIVAGAVSLTIAVGCALS